MTITAQPYAIIAPSLTSCESDEKGCSHQHSGTPAVARRCRCERARSRRVVTALLLAVFSFALFLLASFLWNMAFNEGSWLGSLGLTEDGSAWSAVTGFVKRQATDSGSGQNTFINRKYYLIVVFVGLFLVVLAAICLSAWCCRGSFENPLCCPCYLCACCGGLACLECIGCGLCAEGLDNA
ncbi:hypothetical protein TRAPUB_14389 [Trametes pubescens]|uniref:Uncharacterized protein n=1 Tax=Trametes pubescens TaxID=154538 RepID=A0A1M2VNJ9_TRAPU|nr:hypothetical protein TRAPUB_14389 [Trametes pubescens]